MQRSEALELIKENEKHYEALFSEYNPVTGVGSPIERVRLYLSHEEQSYILLPHYMAKAEILSDIINNYKSVDDYLAHNTDIPREELYDAISQLRIKYDFEFWAATCATIFTAV